MSTPPPPRLTGIFSMTYYKLRGFLKLTLRCNKRKHKVLLLQYLKRDFSNIKVFTGTQSSS